jgi:hypothetical protein
MSALIVCGLVAVMKHDVPYRLYYLENKGKEGKCICLIPVYSSVCV